MDTTSLKSKSPVSWWGLPKGNSCESLQSNPQETDRFTVNIQVHGERTQWLFVRLEVGNLDFRCQKQCNRERQQGGKIKEESRNLSKEMSGWNTSWVPEEVRNSESISEAELGSDLPWLLTCMMEQLCSFPGSISSSMQYFILILLQPFWVAVRVVLIQMLKMIPTLMWVDDSMDMHTYMTPGPQRADWAQGKSALGSSLQLQCPLNGHIWAEIRTKASLNLTPSPSRKEYLPLLQMRNVSSQKVWWWVSSVMRNIWLSWVISFPQSCWLNTDDQTGKPDTRANVVCCWISCFWTTPSLQVQAPEPGFPVSLHVILATPSTR